MVDLKIMWEIFGYIGTCIVASSFLMKSHIRLRMVNTTGAILCVIYSAVVGAYPIVVLNLFIASVNIYFIVQYYKTKEYFRIVPFSQDDTLLLEFLIFYKDDIKLYYPQYKHSYTDDRQCYYILRNMVPAGVFIIRKDAENSAEILLDYVTKEYRDKKIGKFIFLQNREYFLQDGIEKFYVPAPRKETLNYLDAIGFRKNAETGHYEMKTKQI